MMHVIWNSYLIHEVMEIKPSAVCKHLEIQAPKEPHAKRVFWAKWADLMPCPEDGQRLQMWKPPKSHLLDNKGISGVIDETFVSPKVKAYTMIGFMPLSNNPTGCRVRDVTPNEKHLFFLSPMQQLQQASFKKKNKWNIVNAFNLLFFFKSALHKIKKPMKMFDIQ